MAASHDLSWIFGCPRLGDKAGKGLNLACAVAVGGWALAGGAFWAAQEVGRGVLTPVRSGAPSPGASLSCTAPAAQFMVIGAVWCQQRAVLALVSITQCSWAASKGTSVVQPVGVQGMAVGMLWGVNPV